MPKELQNWQGGVHIKQSGADIKCEYPKADLSNGLPSLFPDTYCQVVTTLMLSDEVVCMSQDQI